MDTKRFTRRERQIGLLLGAALVWSIGLIVAAFVLQSYSTVISTSGSSLNGYVSQGATLVQENGLMVLVPISIPLVLSALLALLMGWRRRSKRPLAGIGPWTVVGLLYVVAFLGMFSIGMFVLPVALFCLLACVQAAK